MGSLVTWKTYQSSLWGVCLILLPSLPTGGQGVALFILKCEHSNCPDCPQGLKLFRYEKPSVEVSILYYVASSCMQVRSGLT